MRAIPCVLILILSDLMVSASANAGGFGDFWVRRWGISPQDWGQKVVVDSLGNLFVVGVIQGNYSDPRPNVILKYNSTGDLLWQRTWRGYQNWDHTARSVAVDSSENVYVTGPSVDYDNITLLKLDSAGGLVWGKSWGGINQSFIGLMTNDMATDQAGNIYLTGLSWWNAGEVHLFLLKLNSTGNVVWLRVSIDEFGNGGQALAISPNGDIYVTGQQTAGNPFLLKFDSSGSLLWQESLGSTMPNGITADQQGGAIVAGYVYNGSNGANYVSTILKLDSAGSPLWQRTAPSPLASVAADNESGNIFVTGFTSGHVTLVEFDPFGNVILGRMWASSGLDDSANSVVVDHSGTPVVTGYVAGNPPYTTSLLSTISNPITPNVAPLNASYTTMTVQEESPGVLLQTSTGDTTNGHIFVFRGVPIVPPSSFIAPSYILTGVAGFILASVMIWIVKKRRTVISHAEENEHQK